jgi:hypothetical protein
MGWQVILGIICGIGGIVLSFIACSIMGIVLGGAAIALGLMGRSEHQSGAAVAMALGIAAIVISLVWWLFIGALFLYGF